MTDTTEQEALALIKECVGTTIWKDPITRIDRTHNLLHEALCRAIERDKAFRQEVSEAVEAVKSLWDARDWPSNDKFEALSRFIIAKPDPLSEVLEWLGWTYNGMVRPATALRAAIEKRGGKIVWGEG